MYLISANAVSDEHIVVGIAITKSWDGDQKDTNSIQSCRVSKQSPHNHDCLKEIMGAPTCSTLVENANCFRGENVSFGLGKTLKPKERTFWMFGG
jgi:hypothetical protein